MKEEISNCCSATVSGSGRCAGCGEDCESVWVDKEPYTNDSTYWHDHEVKFESQYSPSGVHITVYEKMSKEEQDDFKKHIKSERDVVTIRFK